MLKTAQDQLKLSRGVGDGLPHRPHPTSPQRMTCAWKYYLGAEIPSDLPIAELHQ